MFERWICGDTFRRVVEGISPDVLRRWFEQEIAKNPVRAQHRNIYKKANRPHDRFWLAT